MTTGKHSLKDDDDMGRSIKLKYRVEFSANARITDTLTTVANGSRQSMGWMVKRHGRPTEANLKAWRDSMNESFRPGGVNDHLAEDVGFVPYVSNCRVVNQDTGEIVAAFEAPAFEVA